MYTTNMSRREERRQGPEQTLLFMRKHKNEFEELFIRASKLDKRQHGFVPVIEREWDMVKLADGVRRFKSHTLGWFRWRVIKSPDELVQILYNLGMVSSSADGKKALPLFNYSGICGLGYVMAPSYMHELFFKQLKDATGRIAYEIKAPLFAG